MSGGVRVQRRTITTAATRATPRRLPRRVDSTPHRDESVRLDPMSHTSTTRVRRRTRIFHRWSSPRQSDVVAHAPVIETTQEPPAPAKSSADRIVARTRWHQPRSCGLRLWRCGRGSKHRTRLATGSRRAGTEDGHRGVAESDGEPGGTAARGRGQLRPWMPHQAGPGAWRQGTAPRGRAGTGHSLETHAGTPARSQPVGASAPSRPIRGDTAS